MRGRGLIINKTDMAFADTSKPHPFCVCLILYYCDYVGPVITTRGSGMTLIVMVTVRCIGLRKGRNIMDNGKREYRLTTIMMINLYSFPLDPFSPQHGQGEHVWFMNTMGGDNSQVRASLYVRPISSHTHLHSIPFPIDTTVNG